MRCWRRSESLAWTVALAANLIAKSGKAVEVAGDIDTLLLDKTGTITLGNRPATLFVPMNGHVPPRTRSDGGYRIPGRHDT